VVESLAQGIERYPMAFGHLLGVADLLVRGAVEIALVGDPTAVDFRALEREVAGHYLPRLVLAGGLPERADGIALLEERPMREARATAYVCRNYACDAPVVEAEELRLQLGRVSE
jgi:uncharacterized protein